jgi:hypothetical protein
VITETDIREALNDWDGDALVTKAHANSLVTHLATRLIPEDDGERDYGVRVSTSEADRVLILPTPSREQAHTTAGVINADSNKTKAEVVWRPAGGWQAES